MDVFDVRIHAMRRRKDRRRPFEVRWHVGGRGKSRSFITRGLADSYRAELVRAARRGLAFDPATGEPSSWAAPEGAAVTWHEHAVAYAAMKWPHAAAHTRAGIADALATITPALTTGPAGRPAAAVLRAALYAHAYNPSRPRPAPGTEAAQALDWAERHSLPLTGLADPRAARRALDALTVRLDGRRAAATTITRKRAVFHGAAGYAAELGLLPASPLDSIRWKAPSTAITADRRAVASPARVQAILTEISRSRPQLTAFFGCLYLAALRPEEAVALRGDCCHLPSSGWGLLIIDTAAPRTAAAWTATGASHEHRGLKQRPEGTTRAIPIPPELVRLLRSHLRAYGTAPDGRLFADARGGILSESTYGRAWHTARAAALSPGLAATPLARRPCDLRHAALSLWVAAGIAPEEAAARAGNSLTVLHAVYAHPVPGQEKAASTLIDRALHPPQSPASHSRRPAPGARGPRLAPKNAARAAQTCPLCVRVTAGPSGTPPDPGTIPPPATAPLTCEDATTVVQGTAADRSRAPHHGQAPAGR
jgi:integrase